MCLEIKNKFKSATEIKKFMKNPLIAEKDLKVYKILEICYGNIVSPFQYVSYTENELKTVKEFKYHYSYDNILYIEDGLHCFSKKRSAIDLKKSLPKTFIVECIIPKGTPYFNGVDNNIVSLALKIPSEFNISKFNKYGY